MGQACERAMWLSTTQGRTAEVRLTWTAGPDEIFGEVSLTDGITGHNAHPRGGIVQWSHLRAAMHGNGQGRWTFTAILMSSHSLPCGYMLAQTTSSAGCSIGAACVLTSPVHDMSCIGGACNVRKPWCC
jgi:hypothetical protein